MTVKLSQAESFFLLKHFVMLKRPSLNKSGGLQRWLSATYSIILGPAEAFGRDETFFKKPQGSPVELFQSDEDKI